MAIPQKNFNPPFADRVLNGSFLFTDPWKWFLRSISDALQSLGLEKSFQLQNDLNAKSFGTSDVNTSTDAISETSHNYYTGLVGQFTTSGSLPGGLSLSTDYYVIKVNVNSYQVASSKANADAGTQVNITSTGSGTHTFTPRGDVTNLKFDKRGVSIAFVDFLIQRVTTSTGATELIEGGCFQVAYSPTSDDWDLTFIGTPGPDDSGVDLSVDGDGQVQYVSSSITGTASISKITWRARTLSAKHSSYSSAGAT